MRRSEQGFTLVEVLVVAAITGFVTIALLSNFSFSRRNLDRITGQVIAHIRDVQNRAASSRQYQSTYRCGYGIVESGTSQFSVYVGPDASTTTCSTENRNYNVGADTIVSTFAISSTDIEFMEDSPGVYFKTVFFEPPDPRTFVDNNSALNASPSRILLRVKGIDCSDVKDCRAICISTAGVVEIQKDLTCP
jgi:prepilin-type N-terminal cleavage/methylation domain-containing protein